MEFGILFTSHPNHATEPYPHRAVHARVTAEARRDTADGILRHLAHFLGSATAGYLGNVSEKARTARLDYDELAATTSPARLAGDRDPPAPRAAREDRAHLALAPLSAPLRPREGQAQPAALAERVMPQFRPA
jgi:hypothetical protein